MKGWWTENLPIKLIALLLTLVLHLVVNEDREEVGVFFVDVISTLPTDKVLLEQPVDKISVSIRGKRSTLTRFRAQPMPPVKINLEDAVDGIYTFSSELVEVPAGLEVISINPSTMPVALDVRDRSTVPVVPRVEGDPAPGFRVVRQRLDPTQVEAIGPSTRLGNIIALTEPLNIQGRAETVEVTLRLRDATDNGVEFRPDKVRMIIEIEEREVERTFKTVPVVVRETRYETTLEPTNVAVTLVGPREAMWGLSQDTITLYLDARQEDGRPPGKRLKEVLVDNLPEGVRVKELNPPQVELTTRPEPEPQPEP